MLLARLFRKRNQNAGGRQPRTFSSPMRVVKGNGRSIVFLLIALLFVVPFISVPAPGSAMAAEPKRILTTFTVIQDMAQNVAGDKAIVESITKPGVEIHGYEPTPSDIVRAQRADLILNNGLGLERWFQKFMGGVGDVPTVDVSDGIDPISVVEGPFEGDPNPHAWMSLTNAKIYVENIRDALVELDPDNADSYRTNAENYIARFQPVEDQLMETLERIPENQRALVTCEGAFSYLARDAGMTELYLWAINADQEGTPAQIRHVIDEIRAHDYPIVFCESTVNTKAMVQVARETGATYGGVLYVDSLTAADGDAPTYLDMLQYNVDTISTAFENVHS